MHTVDLSRIQKGLQSLPYTVQVIVDIDSATVSYPSVSFMYRRNPYVTCVFPQNTIPSGGIQVLFSGEDMDSVQTPVLEITLKNGIIVVSACKRYYKCYCSSVRFVPIPLFLMINMIQCPIHI